MMKSLMAAIERLRKRFDFGAPKPDPAKLMNAAAAKRPPKRKRRR
jgi:hypothetical protein